MPRERQGVGRRFELLLALAIRELRGRYHSITLGALTTFGVSLLMMIVLSTALGGVFRASIQQPYALFVFAALVPWNFLSSTLNQASDSFRRGAPLVRKVPFPRELVPLAVVSANAFYMAIALCSYVPIALLLGARPSRTWLAVPVAVLLLWVFAAGLSLAAATASAFFAEIKPLVEIFVMIWFYATPIFYPASVVPEKLRWVLQLNPMATYVEIFRSLLVAGEWPAASQAILAAAFALAAWLVGIALLRRNQGVIADVVA